MSTSYRLPDWLGGHDVKILRDGEDNNVVVYLLSGPHGGENMTVDRDWLVEVVPPSIDDPVPWPWEARFLHGLVTLQPHSEDKRLTMLEVEDHDDHAAAGRALGADTLRDLARAAWQRANAVEAGAS